MNSQAATSTNKCIGAGFLVGQTAPSETFTPEDFSEQHLLIASTVDQFVREELLPVVERMEHKEYSLTRDLLKKAGELGFSSVEIPEAYGGMDMDKVTSAIVVDRISRYGGFGATWGAHTCIGLLPIVYYGTHEQKERYLSKIASGEFIGAYALSESSSGSDALNCRTRAQLSPDGKEYILNGEKMWITNAGFADLFIVFAKVDGQKFTAFLVEKTFPGFSVGAEEHKLGIRGSSTCPLVFNDCCVPLNNVLGEIGRGHLIALNILNVGRYKLGAAAVGAARFSLDNAVAYAKQRKAFGKSISEFGLIREKIADMAAGVYAGEAMVYRTAGLIDRALETVDKSAPEAAKQTLKVIEEYAIECSIAKVWCSEMLGRVVDETVQVYGGYGYVEEYPAERSYRDARINRIFEGTNEINRLIITGFLLKRAGAGQLPLPSGASSIPQAPPTSDLIEGHDSLANDCRIVQNAKDIVIALIDVAARKYAQALQEQQEVMGAIADMIIEAYAMESTVLRAHKVAQSSGQTAAALPLAMARVYMIYAAAQISSAAMKLTGHLFEDQSLRRQWARSLQDGLTYGLYDVIALRQFIARSVIEIGKFTVGTTVSVHS